VLDAKVDEYSNGYIPKREKAFCACANPACLLVLAVEAAGECAFFDITGALAVVVGLLSVYLGADFGAALLDAVFHLVVKQRQVFKLVYLCFWKKSYSHLLCIYFFITFAKVKIIIEST